MTGTANADDLPALLRGDEHTRSSACAQLRDLLVRSALAYLARLGQPAAAFGADSYEELAEDVAQEAIAIILRQVDTFRADARFTTWAYRIVVNLLADEVRRRVWRRRSLSEPDGRLGDRGTSGAIGTSLEALAERHAVWATIRDTILHDLTPRQRHALLGRVVDGKPLIVLADELDTDKDNVYKLIHDARRRLKHALEAHDLTVADALAAVEGMDE